MFKAASIHITPRSVRRPPKRKPRRPVEPAPDSLAIGAVATLGRELWEVIQRQPESGFGNGVSADTESLGDRARAALWDRQVHLETSITMLLAETAADVLAQLVVAYSMLTRIIDDYPDQDARAEPLSTAQVTAAFRYEEVEFRRNARSVERCLYSIRRYLEASARRSADDFGARFYMPRDDNPFRSEIAQ